MNNKPVLDHIDNNRCITKSTDRIFLYLLHQSLLLELKERGRLNEVQYRFAAEKLWERFGKICREREVEIC